MTRAGWNAPTLVWVVTASVLAAGLFVWPLHIVLAAGQNAVVVLGLAGGWGALVALLQPPRSARCRGLQPILTGLDSVAVAGVVLVDALVLNQLASMLQSIFYYETPRSALLIPLVMVVGLVANRTPTSAWRVATFFVPVLLVLSGGIFALATVNLHHPRALGPTPHLAVIPILHGLRIIAYVGLPLGVTLRRASARLATPPTWRWRLLAVAVPVAFLGSLYTITMGALGPAALTAVRWPVVFVLDHVTLDSTFFLSRIGLVIVFSWTLGVALGLAVHVRLLWTFVPVQPRVRLLGSAVVLGFWTVAALAIPSPNTSSQLLLRWIDGGAVGYLGVELILLGGLRLMTGVRRHRPRSSHTIPPP